MTLKLKNTNAEYGTYNYKLFDGKYEFDVQEVKAYEDTIWVFIHYDVYLIGVVELFCSRGNYEFNRVIETTNNDDCEQYIDTLELIGTDENSVEMHLTMLGMYIAEQHNKNENKMQDYLKL